LREAWRICHYRGRDRRKGGFRHHQVSAVPGPRLSPPERILSPAAVIRDDWLRAGLCVLPADRPAAEAAVTRLYQLIGEPPPRFEWFPSPLAAVAAAPPGQASLRLRAGSAPALGRDWPVAARLATLLAGLRDRLDARIGRRAGPEDALWPSRGVTIARRAGPEDALLAGASLADVLEVTVHDSLRTTLRDGAGAAVRAALARVAGGPSRPAWYGQHDAYWVAHYDLWRRTGLVSYRPDDDAELDLWAALARSAGWWWPGGGPSGRSSGGSSGGLCAMADRPAAVRTEPLPLSWHGELRLHHADGPAIGYRDGYAVHVLHGTPVPAWVITGPSAELISREPNVEVRRSAIERVGWSAYIEQAGLTPVAACADPGNPGSELCLYDVPAQPWSPPARLLVVVNGTPEPDGQHRRYGLSVPPELDDPVAAAGWSYGLTAAQYARLVRRT
jgi:hypothetical protein